MIRKIIYITLCFFIFSIPVYSEIADDLYKDGKFAEAEKAYQKGDMDHPKDLRFRYNRGCAAYQNKDYQGAAAAFTSVLRRAKDKDMLSKAAYNLGNTAFVQNDYANAAEFYKQAIIYNSSNEQAKYNLELSLKKLEEEKNNPDKNKKNKNNKKGNQQKGDQNKGKGDKGKQDQNKSENNSKDKKDGSKDLSGDLNSMNPMGEKQKVKLSPAQMLERKKAEALLDNIKENRAKIMKMQAPDGKRKADSGKTW